MTAAPRPYAPDVVAAVVDHMNRDHPDDCTLIVQTLGGCPGARSAAMAGLDPDGAIFTADVDGGVTEVRVPWAGPVRERGDIRREVVRMYEEGCALAGIAARQAGEH